MHAELGLMPLNERRDIHLSQLCHKNIYLNSVQSLHKFFKPARIVGGRRTRAVDNATMYVPNLKTDKGRQAFEYRGPSHWNKLNEDLRKIEKYATFQRELLKRSSLELDNHPT